MVVKLYGFTMSNCTLRVALILKEMNVPYELVTVDIMNGAHKAPDYVAKHPFGQLPYIDDDGFILYESRAISRYLAMKYASQGPRLIPQVTDLKAYALFEQAASIEESNFDRFAEGLFVENILKKMTGQARDDKRHEHCWSTLDAKLNAYEVILSKTKYLAGNEITLADLWHLPYSYTALTRLPVNLLETPARPNVARWWKDISSRPAWQAVKDGA